MPKRTPVPKALQPVIGVIIGGFFVFQSLSSISGAVQSKSWPTATGVVRSNRVELSKRRNRKPTIRYEYNVYGKKYKACRVRYGTYSSRLGTLFTMFGGEHPLQKKYPKGSRVTVHYAPNQPGKATLETKLPPFFCYFALFLGGAAIYGSLHPKSLAHLFKTEKRKKGKKKKHKSKKKDRRSFETRYPSHS